MSSHSPAPLHVPSPWRILTTPGHSRLSVPPDATWSLQADEPVLAITLHTWPRTQVFVCRWPLPDVQIAGDTATALDDQLRIFAAIGTGSLAPRHLAQLQFQSAANEQFVKSHASLELEADESWLARAIARQGGNYFLLIHWSGPDRYLLDYVERIFDSLDFPPDATPDARPDAPRLPSSPSTSPFL